MGLAASGADVLAAAQSSGGEGRAQEAAVLGALRALNTAMQHDSEIIGYLQQAGSAGAWCCNIMACNKACRIRRRGAGGGGGRWSGRRRVGGTDIILSLQHRTLWGCSRLQRLE